MALTEDDIARIENIITKVFDLRVPSILNECRQKDDLVQAQCEAHRIFIDKENAKSFFATKDNLENHIEVHKKKEVTFKWVISIIISLFTARMVWDFFHWFMAHS